MITKATRPGSKTALILKTKTEHPDLTTRQIGAIADCTHVNVITTLRRYGVNHTHLQDYKANKADILAGLTHRIALAVTDSDIKKAPMGSKVLAMAQLIDKEQLIRGLSTANIGVVLQDVAAIRALDRGEAI